MGCTTRKVHTIVVEVCEKHDLDNDVVLACVEHIISNNCLRSSRGGRLSKPRVSILTTDQQVKDYEKLCKRTSSPSSAGSLLKDCIIDGYSRWYPVPLSVADKKMTNNYDMVHIGEWENKEMNDGNEYMKIISDVANILLQKSKSKQGLLGQQKGERIVVIDSLSSIGRYVNCVNWMIGIRDCFSCEKAVDDDDDDDMTMIVTMRTSQQQVCSQLSNYESVKGLADTHVSLRQIRRAGIHKSGGEEDAEREEEEGIWMEVCRRRASGRVVLESMHGKLDEGEKRLIDVKVTESSSATERDARKKAEEEEEKLRDSEEEERFQLEQELARRGLTFRVSLSSREREMRAQAGLPYLHQDEKVADTALELHPKHLQVGRDDDDESGSCSSSSADDFADEDDEGELFSEDV